MDALGAYDERRTYSCDGRNAKRLWRCDLGLDGIDQAGTFLKG